VQPSFHFHQRYGISCTTLFFDLDPPLMEDKNQRRRKKNVLCRTRCSKERAISFEIGKYEND